MAKSSFLSGPVLNYLTDQHPPDDIERRLIAETAALGGISVMQITPSQGALMTVITKLVGASSALEVGTFTGYSALCIARGLPADGRLVCLDVSEEWTAIARKYWTEAGVSDRIELRLGPAVESLAAMAPDPVWDLAFIDADKPNYPQYWEQVVSRIRPGGIIMVDNVLWDGLVADPDTTDANARILQRFNASVAADDRVDAAIIPIGDGLTVAVRRA